MEEEKNNLNKLKNSYKIENSKEDLINEEETIKCRSNKKYINYIKWLEENGSKFSNINFPTCFGRFGYVGISAKKDLPSNKAIICIPNKLLITTHLVKKSEIGKIIEENKEFFHDIFTEDADFNTLSLFILYEKLKHKNSFYFPMIDLSENNYTILDWSEKEIEDLEDEGMKKQAEEFRSDMEKNWLELLIILKKYPEIFLNINLESIKSDYFWSYCFVMTRCYGWSLPSTILVPLADFLNHNNYGVNHFLIHKKFEKFPHRKNDEYNIKKFKVDLEEIGEKELSSVYKPNNIEKKEMIDYYIEQNIEYKEEKLNKKDNVLLINYKKLIEEKNKHVYHLSFFDSSDDEDNDTDQDNDSKKDVSEEFDEEKELINYNGCNQIEKQQSENGIKTLRLSPQKQKTNKKDSEGSEIEDETEWSWYDPNDDDIYFIVSTTDPVKKNEQIFNCYGRRNNRFLLAWYGFTLRKNKYDSVSLRFLMIKNASEMIKEIEENIFYNYITYDEWASGYCYIDKKKVFLSNISKEIRLKKSILCEEIVQFIRFQVSQIVFCDNKIVNKDVAFLNPIFLDQEVMVFNLIMRILIFLKNKFISCIKDNINIIENESLDVRKYFSAIFKENNILIIDEQIKLVKLIQNILKRMKSGFEFKQSYMEFIPEIESNEIDFMNNRRKIGWYIRKFYIGIVLNLKY